MKIDQLLENLWNDYTSLNPAAKKIQESFIQKGEPTVINDHIAFRTFQSSKLGIEKLSQHFEKSGYKESGEYEFKEKKLYAKHFENKERPELPKIFISEIMLEHFSKTAQTLAQKYIQSVDDNALNSPEFLYSGKHWESSYKEYELLKEESEYLAWLSAFGFRANHFTVSINHLQNFSTLPEVNSFIKGLNIKLNTAGGEIKGGQEVFLEQSSTLSFNAEIDFKEGKKLIPTTYYEFAKRYPMKNGELYQGFVAKSADKIFESTNLGQ